MMETEGMKRHLPPLISGVALVFCFPTFDLYPLAWVALAPFLVSVYGMSPRNAFRAGFFMGVPYFFGTQYWIYHSINHYGGIPLLPSLAIVLLLSFYMSLYTAAFASLFSYKMSRSKLPAMLLAPLLWVCLEYLRSYALTGFPWSSIGYTQYKFLPVIQIADMTGVYGVSYLVVAVNGALADIFIARRRKRRMPLFSLTPTATGGVVLAAAILGILLYGHMRLNEKRPGAAMRVGIVQGNIEQDVKWDPAYQSEVTGVYKEMTVAVNDRRPDLIVWPETAVPFYFGADEKLTAELMDFQKGLDAYLLFGAVTVKADGRLANSAILLGRGGPALYAYDKIHLVPFGEYVPLKGALFFIDKLAAGIGDYVPGKEHIKAQTPMGKFGTLICYEIIFPGLVRKFYQKDGDFIVTITNDAWFGDTTGPYQHFSMAVLRAVENRKPVIRAANTGVSGFIDSSGRILKRSSLFQRQALTENVHTDSTRSFYSRWGDLFAYLSIVLCLLIFMA